MSPAFTSLCFTDRLYIYFSLTRIDSANVGSQVLFSLCLFMLPPVFLTSWQTGAHMTQNTGYKEPPHHLCVQLYCYAIYANMRELYLP